MDRYELLRTAILERRQVAARYDGLPREFCPHILGTRAGKQRVLVFQFGGETSKGPILSPLAGD